MYSWNLEKDRREAECYLTEKRSDFVATYMTVSNLQFIIDQQPEIITEATVSSLACVLAGKEHATQRQAYFLYKKAGDALGAIIHQTGDSKIAEQAKDRLIQTLRANSEKPCRAAAQALGTLPLHIKGPCLSEHKTEKKDTTDPHASILPDVCWQTLIDYCGFPTDSSGIFSEWKGRNLVISSKNTDEVLVVKMTRPGEDPAMLAQEGLWMNFLAANQDTFIGNRHRFHIPMPVTVSGSFLFRLTDMPKNLPENNGIDPRMPVIGFMTTPDYFVYPNEHPPEGFLPQDTFFEIITRSALLLGRLAASGIIHTAPIPLFHNRVQRHRRDDGGLYQWPRGGRLDQWLSSCRFPNIGGTGLRDFEHFISFNDSSRKLYERIGSHIFSLVLISGSYFRSFDPARVGLDPAGNPVDARDLFDPDFLERTVKTIFTHYYKGFTGSEFTDAFPMDLARFSQRLVEEMGVDRHMEEVLRVAEQNEMSDEEFYLFLAGRGVAPEQISSMKKGEKDITILTGPHLGGFNQPISVPELIRFTSAAAALCISGRYCQEKFAA
jgi:hypothetical protein